MSAVKKIIIACLALASCVYFASCTPRDDFLDIIPEGDPEIQKDVDDTAEKEKEEAFENAVSAKESRKEIEALAAEAVEKMSVIPEYPAGYPTLEAVVEQYKKANMVIGWIINTERIATFEDDTYETNGMTYQRVRPDCHYGEHAFDHSTVPEEHEKLIYNKKTLEAYLATLIHPEEASDYMIDLKEGYDIPRLVQGENGALYALPFSYTPAGFGKDESYELTPDGDGSYTFTVNYTFTGKDGEAKPRQYKTDYVKVDGRWVFENFRVFRQ